MEQPYTGAGRPSRRSHNRPAHPPFVHRSNHAVNAQPGSNLVHYGVRITVSDIKNVVVNCFAIDSSGKIIAGNTVLHNDLVEVT